MHVLPTQNENIISVLVTGSSFTNVVSEHTPFGECNRIWKIFCEINSRWNCPCARCELSGELEGLAAEAEAGAEAGRGGGGGAEKRRYIFKKFSLRR